jgi:hypothetical protein
VTETVIVTFQDRSNLSDHVNFTKLDNYNYAVKFFNLCNVVAVNGLLL